MNTRDTRVARAQPDSIGPYRVVRELGRGGMGVVYEAVHAHLRRRVAIKLMLPDLADDPQALERFVREARAASNIRHPHVIEVYDYGLDGEGPYYTMECLTGESLRTQAPRHWAQVCALGRDIASALALLHSRSLIHRAPRLYML